jgi:hypothetical protein
LLVAGEQGVRRLDLTAGEFTGDETEGHPVRAVRMLTTLHFTAPAIRGDLNGDTLINGFDIEPFVLSLTDPSGFAAQHPFVLRACAADINRDGSIDGFDIEPFVQLLTGSP